MLSDVSQWKFKNGILDTSDGDKKMEEISLYCKKYKIQYHLKSRIKLTEKQRKQHIKEYQHKYYLEVTKIKRKNKYKMED